MGVSVFTRRFGIMSAKICMPNPVNGMTIPTNAYHIRHLQQDEPKVTAMHTRPIVLSGPSGGGKSTILTKAMKEYPDSFAFSVSHTTRKPREGELDGVHYYFTERSVMEKMIDNGEFLESAEFGGNFYGTSKKAVEDVEKAGKICVLDIELQGVRNIKSSHLKAKYILIKAPSIKALEERLRARGSETEDTLQKRLKHAQEDLDAVEQNPTLFDHIIVNDNIDSAYKQFINSISEELASVSTAGNL